MPATARGRPAGGYGLTMVLGPPPITHRHDGALTLGGYCADDCHAPCQLVVWRTDNGTVRLAFHGTQQHSITLTDEQQAALHDLLTQRRSAAESSD